MGEITERIRSYIAADETIKAARAGDGSAVVVTDRRVFDLEQSTKDGRDLTVVNSTVFTGDDISGVKISQVESGEVDTVEIGLAALLGLLGASVLGASFSVDDTGGVVLLLLGVFLLFLAAYTVYEALKTPDGHIRVTLESEGEPIDELTLSDEEADVASSICEAVGEAHAPR
jgi:hypothetical protein